MSHISAGSGALFVFCIPHRSIPSSGVTDEFSFDLLSLLDACMHIFKVFRNMYYYYCHTLLLASFSHRLGFFLSHPPLITPLQVPDQQHGVLLFLYFLGTFDMCILQDRLLGVSSSSSFSHWLAVDLYLLSTRYVKIFVSFFLYVRFMACVLLCVFELLWDCGLSYVTSG